MKLKFVSNNNLIRDCIIFSLKETGIFVSEIFEREEITPEDLYEKNVLFIFVAIGLKNLLELISSHEQEMIKIAGSNKVIVITDIEEEEYIRKSMALGVNGYITMDSGLEMVMPVVRMVCAGGSFIPARCFLTSNHCRHNDRHLVIQDNNLTNRQLEILSFLKQGRKSKDIACMLSISESTVGVHVMNIMRKLGVKKRNEMISIRGIPDSVAGGNAFVV